MNWNPLRSTSSEFMNNDWMVSPALALLEDTYPVSSSTDPVDPMDLFLNLVDAPQPAPQPAPMPAPMPVPRASSTVLTWSMPPAPLPAAPSQKRTYSQYADPLPGPLAAVPEDVPEPAAAPIIDPVAKKPCHRPKRAAERLCPPLSSAPGPSKRGAGEAAGRSAGPTALSSLEDAWTLVETRFVQPLLHHCVHPDRPWSIAVPVMSSVLAAVSDMTQHAGAIGEYLRHVEARLTLLWEQTLGVRWEAEHGPVAADLDDGRLLLRELTAHWAHVDRAVGTLARALRPLDAVLRHTRYAHRQDAEPGTVIRQWCYTVFARRLQAHQDSLQRAWCGVVDAVQGAADHDLLEQTVRMMRSVHSMHLPEWMKQATCDAAQARCRARLQAPGGMDAVSALATVHAEHELWSGMSGGAHWQPVTETVATELVVALQDVIAARLESASVVWPLAPELQRQWDAWIRLCMWSPVGVGAWLPIWRRVAVVPPSGGVAPSSASSSSAAAVAGTTEDSARAQDEEALTTLYHRRAFLERAAEQTAHECPRLWRPPYVVPESSEEASPEVQVAREQTRHDAHWERVIRTGRFHPAALAQCIHRRMTARPRVMPADDVVLQGAVFVYQHAPERDRIEAQLLQWTAVRLLPSAAEPGALAQSEALAAEHQLLNLLRDQETFSNGVWVKRVEQLLLDARLWDSLNRSMHSRVREAEGSAAVRDALDTIHLAACATAQWPMRPVPGSAPTPPPEMQRLFAAAVAGYQQVHPKRRLTLQLECGGGVLTVRLRGSDGVPRPLRVSGTSLMMAVLCLFNQKSVWSVADLVDTLGVPLGTLAPHLNGLRHPKRAGVIVKREQPASPGLAPDDTLQLVSQWTKPQWNIAPLPFGKVGGADERGGAGVDSETDRGLELQRRSQGHACLVRIMKARRTASFMDLLAECRSQMARQFAVTDVVFKSWIDSLLEQEYLRRDAENRHVFHYIA